MKRSLFLALLCGALVLAAQAIAAPQTELVLRDNPSSPVVTPATVRLLPAAPEATRSPRADGIGATLTPADLAATLPSGGCIVEDKSLFLPADIRPPRLDLMFCLDLTGSMGGELANIKVNSVNIMNTLRGFIPDSDFGVMSHMDYNGSFSGCNYGSSYGSGPDYPYALGSPIQANLAAVSAAINALALGFGNDGPENYTRPFYESYADPAVAWRAGAKRFLVAWLDAIPHDCDVFACTGPAGISTGPDPGRDNIAGNGDDLPLLATVDAMAAANITLLVLYSGGSASELALWQCLAQRTPGGDAFGINADGTIPGGTDIADFIRDRVGESIQTITNLTLGACDPAFAAWISNVEPPSYADVVLDMDHKFDFQLTLCVPADTPEGEYCFAVCALGDGAELARQNVCITVDNNDPPNCDKALAAIESIWPPNHKFTAVSIVGVDDPDGDPVTITVTGIWQDEPLNTVGDGNTCPDGEIVDGVAYVRMERSGTPSVPGNGRVYHVQFTASDGRESCEGVVTVCVPHDQGMGSICVDDGPLYNSLGPCKGALKGRADDAPLATGLSVRATGRQAVLEYSLAQDADVNLSVFDVAGRRVATLEHTRKSAGHHTVTWDAGVARGLYFYRLQAGGAVISKTVLHAE